MSGMEKSPIPEDPVERFMVSVWMLIEPFKINEVPEIFRYVELLGNAVDSYLFEKRHHVSPQKKVHADRQKFISIFKTRYLHLTDMEYTRSITNVDGKLIHQVNKKLSDCGFDCEEFLKWVFETFLPENPKFCPPFIRTVCCDVFVTKFLYEHKDVVKERNLDKMRKIENAELFNRARTLIRSDSFAKRT